MDKFHNLIVSLEPVYLNSHPYLYGLIAFVLILALNALVAEIVLRGAIDASVAELSTDRNVRLRLIKYMKAKNPRTSPALINVIAGAFSFFGVYVWMAIREG